METSGFFGDAAAMQLQRFINDGAFLADVRTPAEFESGHVKGSVNIPLDRIPGELSSFHNKKAIVVFCRSGARSSAAKSILDQAGIANVINGGTWDYINQFVK